MTDNGSRREPIVARRDGNLTDAPPKGYQATFASVDPPKTRKGGGAVWVVMFLLILGLAGLGWFSWQQSQQQALLQKRFDELAAKIESTDESLSQSGAALSVKLSDQQKELEKHWSEINKLWGVANDRNKKSIKALQKSVAAADNANKQLQKSLDSLKSTHDKTASTLGELRSSILAAGAEVDEIAERVETALAGQQKLDRNVDQKLRGLESRLRTNEKAMESVDAFRRQTNQTLEALRSSPVP